MTPSSRRPLARTALFIRVGSWFEARATGWAVLIVPVVLLSLLAAAWLMER
jgi:hypothetical protein